MELQSLESFICLIMSNTYLFLVKKDLIMPSEKGKCSYRNICTIDRDLKISMQRFKNPCVMYMYLLTFENDYTFEG